MDFLKVGRGFHCEFANNSGLGDIRCCDTIRFKREKVRVNGGVNKMLNKQKKILFSDKNDRRNSHVDRINSRCILR